MFKQGSHSLVRKRFKFHCNKKTSSCNACLVILRNVCKKAITWKYLLSKKSFFLLTNSSCSNSTSKGNMVWDVVVPLPQRRYLQCPLLSLEELQDLCCWSLAVCNLQHRLYFPVLVQLRYRTSGIQKQNL